MNERRGRALTSGLVVATSALALGPLLTGRGFALVGDMSFVPDQPWKAAWLGLDGSAPRAVPADAVVWALSQVVPGDLVQKTLLLGALIAAGLGMCHLVRRTLAVGSETAVLAAGLLYLWNPYVLERLAIGHWGLLLGYAALPWVVAAAVAVRDGEPGALARLVLASAPAALGSPTGGLLAAAVALVLTVGTPLRRGLLPVLASATLLNLPWLVPGLTGAATGNDPGGVDAFSARADSPFGLWGSLLTLGGIWKSSIVPGERDGWFLVALALAASAAALVALGRAARRGDRTAAALVALGTLGLLLAALPGTGPGADATGWLVEHVAGTGILRDSQKYVALLALPVAAGFGLAVGAGMSWVRVHGLASGPFGVVAAAAPLVLLPSLAWGIAGAVEPVRYPGDWAAARDVLADRSAAEQSTAVLPFSAYQRFAWNDGRAALDPAIRFFPGRVVTNDELGVADGRAVAGDDAAAARIGRALDRGEPLPPVLAEEGIRFVLVEKSAAGGDELPEIAGTVVHDGPELRLIDTGARGERPRAEAPALIVVGDLLTGFTILAAGAFLALRQIPRKIRQIG